MPTLEVPRYRIQARLGRSVHGESFRAADLATGNRVVIRFLPPRLASSEERQDQLRFVVDRFAELRDPLVVPAAGVDAGHIGRRSYVVREFVPGQTLADLAARGPVDGSLVMLVGSQLARALEVLQDRGLVHGDITPSNIILDNAGHVKLVDAGLGYLPTWLSAQLYESVVGSPLVQLLNGFWPISNAFRRRNDAFAYAAPEHSPGEPADQTGDLYSVGMVLYHLATGGPPSAVAGRFRSRAPTPRADELNRAIQPQLGDVIAELIEPQPSARIQGVDQLAGRLYELSLSNAERDQAARASRPATAAPEARVSAQRANWEDADDMDEMDEDAGIDEDAEIVEAVEAANGSHESEVKPRFLNTWFKTHASVPPLVVGTAYQFNVNIGQPRHEPRAESRQFHEPNFGAALELQLLIGLYTRDFHLKTTKKA